MQILFLSLVTSGLVIIQTIQSQGIASNLEPEEDVLEEAVADGFLVELKAASSAEEYKKQTATTVNSVNTDVGPPLPSLEERLPTVHNESLLINVSHEVGTELTTENPKDLAKVLSKNKISPLPGNTEGSGNFPDLMITEEHNLPKLTKRVTDTTDTPDTGSGMFSETIYKKHQEDSVSMTTVAKEVRMTTVAKEHFSFSTLLSRLPEGPYVSGMGPEVTTVDGVTTEAIVIVKKVPESKANIEKELERDAWAGDVSDIEPEVKASFKPRVFAPRDPEPTVSARAEKRTPDWLIIFATCLTVGAILCVLAAIATKDSWYGPCSQGNNAAPTPSKEEYDKKSTLPLSDKEQQLLTLVSPEKEEQNKDFSIINVQDLPEKEYLM